MYKDVQIIKMYSIIPVALAGNLIVEENASIYDNDICSFGKNIKTVKKDTLK